MKDILSRVLGLCLSIGILFLVACEDDLDLGPTVTVTNANPASAFTLDQVTLQGENLHTVRNVFVGDRHCELTAQNESSLSFIVPATADPGANTITLAMAKGYRVTYPIEVLVRPIPEIQTISPSAANIGEQVTIRGLNLGELTSTKIGGIDAEIVSATNTELVLSVPSGLPINATADIELATSEVTRTSTSIFYVGPNLIANSDFEGGSGDDFDSWEKLNGGDQMTAVTGDAAYAGRSIRIVGAGNPDQPWRTQLANRETQWNFNSEYTLVFWAKAEAEGASMRVSASQFNHHGSGSDFFYGDQTSVPTEWTQLTWTFQVTADLPSYKMVFDLGFTTVPIVIDNVALIETGAAGPQIPDNLVANPGFEDGLTSWEIANGTFEVSAEEVHCGAQALKVTGAGNPDQAWRTQIVAADMPLVAGTEYVVSLWAKATAPDVPVSVSVSRWNNSDGSDYFYSDIQTITQEWAEYTWRFTAQDPASGVQHLVLDLGRSDQIFYVDDVSLKEYISPLNLLVDGSFENGISSEAAPNEDASWSVTNGTFEVVTNADDVFEGSQSLQVTGAGNPDQAWRTQIAHDHIPELVAGTEYRVSLMAKATAPDVPISISVSRWNNSDGSDYFYSDPVTITEEWAEYSWTFVAQDPPSGMHHLVLDLGRSAEVFFIDDIVIAEVPPFQCP